MNDVKVPLLISLGALTVAMFSMAMGFADYHHTGLVGVCMGLAICCGGCFGALLNQRIVR
jgi:hypothetical protein